MSEIKPTKTGVRMLQGFAPQPNSYHPGSSSLNNGTIQFWHNNNLNFLRIDGSVMQHSYGTMFCSGISSNAYYDDWCPQSVR